MLKLYNTLSRKKEKFVPIDKSGLVGLYTCGPTVYWFVHIGNLRTYIFEDILKRVLEYNRYKVKHVMNITDVGHLTSDADTGEDKLEKSAGRESKSVQEIAQFYFNIFKKDLKLLNILPPTKWIKATDTIQEQIDFIRILEEKGFSYKTMDGVYFDTSKLSNYGRLWGKKQRRIKPGARVELIPDKKNPTDFALWKFSPKETKRQREWDSPWGVGFPGWHTECVVMAEKTLGIPFDIHCGGVDHIFIHHTNEIAQAEAAYGKLLANFWLHGEFLKLKSGRMGKSEGNIITLGNIIDRGINPLSFRYLCLNTHYRSPLTFSLDSLQSAQNTLSNIYISVKKIKTKLKTSPSKIKPTRKTDNYQRRFDQFINDDLNTPRALSVFHNVLDSKKLSTSEKYFLILNFDRIFGLRIKEVEIKKLPGKIEKLVEEREKHREKNEWEEADSIRKKIESYNYSIEDTKDGPILIKK